MPSKDLTKKGVISLLKRFFKIRNAWDKKWFAVFEDFEGSATEEKRLEREARAELLAIYQEYCKTRTLSHGAPCIDPPTYNDCEIRDVTITTPNRAQAIVTIEDSEYFDFVFDIELTKDGLRIISRKMVGEDADDDFEEIL